MITITTTSERETTVARQVADEAVLRDPAFNGATIHVERGDYLSIDGGEELACAALLADIHAALEAR